MFRFFFEKPKIMSFYILNDDDDDDVMEEIRALIHAKTFQLKKLLVKLGVSEECKLWGIGRNGKWARYLPSVLFDEGIGKICVAEEEPSIELLEYFAIEFTKESEREFMERVTSKLGKRKATTELKNQPKKKKAKTDNKSTTID